MQEQAVDDWLTDLASAAPTPGGGGAAGLMAATGAALVSMVCNLTIGKAKYAEHEDVLRRTLDEATELRMRALQLANDDARAFDAVIAAYRLPRGTPQQQDERREAVQAALAGAADVPLQTAELAIRIIELSSEIVDRSNPNVLSDVAVAATAAGAALKAAKVNIAVNLAAIEDEETRRRLSDALAGHLGAVEKSDAVTAEVEKRLGR